MKADIVPTTERAVARPLKVLEKLIKEHIEQGDKAGMDYYRLAGEELNEAQGGHYDGDASGFWRWALGKFGKTKETLRTWMALTSVSSRKPFKSLEDVKRHQNPSRYDHTIGRRFREWTAPVDDIAERARKEAFRLAQDDALTRAQERDAERALAHRLIDIGYKVLAKELHPDKVGGSRDAMKRLNHVRDKLKHSI